jgi:hypothetical protein
MPRSYRVGYSFTYRGILLAPGEVITPETPADDREIEFGLQLGKLSGEPIAETPEAAAPMTTQAAPASSSRKSKR